MEIREINIKDIYVPYDLNLRRRHDEAGVKELMESIKAEGQLQPCIINSKINSKIKEDGYKYELVVGFRRYEAIQKLGYCSILSIIKEINTIKEQYFINLAENLAREKLTAEDEGCAYKRLHDEFNMEYSEIAVRVGKTLSYIKVKVNILNTLLPAQRKYVAKSDKIINISNKAGRASPSSASIIGGSHLSQKAKNIIFEYARKDGFTTEHVRKAVSLAFNQKFDADTACLIVERGCVKSPKLFFATKDFEKDARKLEITEIELLYRILEGKIKSTYQMIRQKE